MEMVHTWCEATDESDTFVRVLLVAYSKEFDHINHDLLIAYTCHMWWNYTAQSLHKLKVAFSNAFRMMHTLPTYCSASEMFTVNRVGDCKAVIKNLVHRFMMRLTISKHLLVRSIFSSDLVCSSRIRRQWARVLYVHYHGG